jgi:hypothetical protein
VKDRVSGRSKGYVSISKPPSYPTNRFTVLATLSSRTKSRSLLLFNSLVKSS